MGAVVSNLDNEKSPLPKKSVIYTIPGDPALEKLVTPKRLHGECNAFGFKKRSWVEEDPATRPYVDMKEEEVLDYIVPAVSTWLWKAANETINVVFEAIK